MWDDFTNKQPLRSESAGQFPFGSKTRLFGDVTVDSDVVPLPKKLKVLNPVIELVVILVVNNLRAQKWTPKMLFHNKAVFVHQLATNPNSSITEGLRDRATLPPRVLRAKLASVLVELVANGKTVTGGHIHPLGMVAT